MYKSLLTLAILGLLIMFTSAYYTAPADSRIGYKAPALVLDNNNGLSPLQQHRDGNVLLTFWCSTDVESRLSNKRYDRLSRSDKGHFTHVSVNLDRSNAVFKSVVEIDDLDRTTQFCTSVKAQEAIIKSWRLEDGYHSFLLNPQGQIIAIDPSEQQLASLEG